MSLALLGLAMGLGAGAASVGGLWLVTRLAASLASELRVSTPVEKPSGWDREHGSVAPTASSAARSSLPGRPSPESRQTIRAALLLFLTFLLKAPLLLLVAFGARSLGGAALPWCVAGVVSVYCLAVFWAAARTRTG